MPTSWTRRQFAQTLAATAAATLLPSNALASPHPLKAAFFAADNAIQVFQVAGARRSLLQTHPALAPTGLTLHPALPILYALHDVALWHNLPRGAVSAYSIATTGHLTHLATQPLSLAATNPSHAAISPDATFLAIASPTSGIFNILPIAPDGTLQPPTIIRKHLSPDTAETHALVFPDNRTLLTADSRHTPLHAFTIEADLLLPTRIDSTLTLPTPTSLAFRPA